MKKMIMLATLIVATMQAQAITTVTPHIVVPRVIATRTTPHVTTTSPSSSKLTKTATTLTPNPVKKNEIVKAAKPAHVTAGAPVASLNTTSPASACEEKKEVKAVAKCSK